MPVKFVWPTRPKLTHGQMLDTGLSFPGGNGATIIFVHGLTGTPYELRFLATALNTVGYSAICPRLPHHGGPIQILKNTTWQECYESIRQTLLSIDPSSHPGPIFVAGLSMGALLALLLAEEFPDRIRGVSCLSPTFFYDGWNTPWSSKLLPWVGRTPLKHCFYFKEGPPYGVKNETIRERIHSYYHDAPLNDTAMAARYGYAYIPVTLLYELQRLAKHTGKLLARIQTPVQILQAKDDDMTSIKNANFIYDRIRSTVKEVVLLSNSYHLINADQERETVARQMIAFFDRLRIHP